MKPYIVTSDTNYGETVVIIIAHDEEDARWIAEKDNRVWSGYSIKEIDTQIRGVAAFGGGV